MTVSLVLAEDSFIVREGMRMLFEQAGGYELAAVCEDLDGLLEAVDRFEPDVVITDIRMPPSRTDEGIRAARTIRRRHPQTGVVVLSQYVEPDYALHLFAEGSAGLAYLLKERLGDLDQLTHAVEQVRAGGSVIDSRVVDVLVQARAAVGQSRLSRLTKREREVLSEVAKGLTNSAIAARLFLSERAVEKHINSIFTKLDLAHEADANRRVRAVLLYLAETGDAG